MFLTLGVASAILLLAEITAIKVALLLAFGYLGLLPRRIASLSASSSIASNPGEPVLRPVRVCVLRNPKEEAKD